MRSARNKTGWPGGRHQRRGRPRDVALPSPARGGRPAGRRVPRPQGDKPKTNTRNALVSNRRQISTEVSLAETDWTIAKKKCVENHVKTKRFTYEVYFEICTTQICKNKYQVPKKGGKPAGCRVPRPKAIRPKTNSYSCNMYIPYATDIRCCTYTHRTVPCLFLQILEKIAKCKITNIGVKRAGRNYESFGRLSLYMQKKKQKTSKIKRP